MNSKQFQFNQRSVIPVALAVLLLTLTAIPALAWADEGGPDFQPARSCQVKVAGDELSNVDCVKIWLSHPSRVISEGPTAPLGVIRAEEIFLQNWQSVQLIVEADQE